VELVTILVTNNRVGEQGTGISDRPRRSRQQAARVLVDMNDGGLATPVSRSSTRGINISYCLIAPQHWRNYVVVAAFGYTPRSPSP
jgi:hypothetical protein